MLIVWIHCFNVIVMRMRVTSQREKADCDGDGDESDYRCRAGGSTHRKARGWASADVAKGKQPKMLEQPTLATTHIETAKITITDTSNYTRDIKMLKKLHI